MKAIDRVKQYIDYKGLNNSSFEKKNELSNGYIATQLKRKADLGEGILNKILDNCLDINAGWLLTGKGEMIKEENNGIKPINGNRKTKSAIIDIQEVPFYDLEATAGLQELFDSGKPHKVLDTIKIPNLPKCDGAITVTGDSMYPLLKSGDMVLYKEISLDNIFFGEMYLLSVKIDHWEEYITVKYVQRSEKGEEYVKLVSQNSHHQPKDIKLNQISAIALVKASVRFNTMS
ncbi:peptidase S24 [Elizabethkingia anophelis]|nr:peptidase S24 [Elizabethkingia anophelis]HAY3590623.1 helix-turn-helix transcriptional regulator [Elizabethkingia anophelis]